MSLARVLLDLLRERRHAQKLLRQIIKNQEDTMAAIDNLDTAVAGLTAKVDQLLTTTKPDPTLEAKIQADADAVTAQTGRIDTFVNPLPTP